MIHGGSRRRRQMMKERGTQTGLGPALPFVGGLLTAGSSLGNAIPGSDFIPFIGTEDSGLPWAKIGIGVAGLSVITALLFKTETLDLNLGGNDNARR